MMAVRRRRKGKPVQIILDAGSLREIEMHARDADRQSKAGARFVEKNTHSKRTNPSLSQTVSSAVQSMRIEDA